ncbi:hypothetical protein BKA70DRAFT_118209 [Coprinopsis sp. MPI-PUGE-AT-0042]|nr:hypothetical protein BKA70DRAFT_118209 [Coprinopsis sp. MPI-PUGE-AT-0042]
MDSPPELSPYLSTNIPFPRELRPILEAYLEQTSSIVASLDAEVNQLERALDAKKRTRDYHKKNYEEHSRLPSLSRTVPPEVWGAIFAFTLGDEPFGQRERRTYAYLREVCTIWRDVVATPDICRGLVFTGDTPRIRTPYRNERGIQSVKDHLEPWLAIVSRNHPYHLILDAEHDRSFVDNDHNLPDICE